MCQSQTPPNTNQDETLPPFMMSTFDEAYLKYIQIRLERHARQSTLQLAVGQSVGFATKPNSFQGVDLGYTTPGGFTIEGADMLTFENRTSSSYGRQTLLTSYPSGYARTAVEHHRSRR